MNVAVFVGAPVLGGKGTTCELVQRCLSERGVLCTHFSVGDALRERAKKDPELARILETRQLVSDEYVLRVLEECVPKKGVVLYDGFPRNNFQAMVALQLFQNKADWVTVAAHMRVPPEVVLSRLASRIQESPERSDSTEELVCEGLGVYWSKTYMAFKMLAVQADSACEISVTSQCPKEDVAEKLYRHINSVLNEQAFGAVMHSHTSPAVLSRR